MRIAKVRASGRIFDGVRIFRSFRPGVVITYNVDGLLIDLPRSPHRIFDAHGSVPTFLANPIAARWLEPGIAEEIAPVFYSINIDEPERWERHPTRGSFMPLSAALRISSRLSVILSARQADGSHNDSLSLFRFCERF